MTAQQYLESILSKYNLTDSATESIRNKRSNVQDLLEKTYGSKIRMYYSGSIGKKTAISLSYDLDLCVYFPPDRFSSLKEMYESMRDTVRRLGAINERNVSIQLPQGSGTWIDVVPARQIAPESQEANLYARLSNSSIKTNIPAHIKLISDSECRPVIKLMKIWKYQNKLEFKSFALELMTIKALEQFPDKGLGERFWHTLKFVRDNIDIIKLVDPANSNNIVSDVVPFADKIAMRNQATATINRASTGSWQDVVA